MPGSQILEGLLGEAKTIDPAVATSSRLRPRLQMLLDQNPTSWINWAEHETGPIVAMTNDHARISNTLTSINVTQWVNETRSASSRRPGLFEKMTGTQKSPTYYNTMLTKCRSDLQRLVPEIERLRETLVEHLESLRLDVVVLQLGQKTIDNPVHVTAVANRLRSLVATQQHGMTLMGSFDLALTTILTAIQDIDDVLVNTIPAWTLAQNLR